jgi:site-specific recombinase XerC
MPWHDLRQTYGSLLAASSEELVTIKPAMGHANITTTEIYLHARPATELAKRFTTAFTSTAEAIPPSRTDTDSAQSQ